MQNRKSTFSDQYLIQLRVTQPLWDPAISTRTRQSLAQVWSSDWAQAQVYETVMLRSIELYAELVRHSRLTELARENLLLHRRYVGQIKDIARADTGRASDLPVAQSRVALAESVLASRLARLESARIQWRAHSTLPSPEESSTAPLALVLRDLPDVDLPISLESALEESLEQHPLVQKALTDLQAVQAGLSLASDQAAPRVGAELSQRQSNNHGGVYGQQRGWYAGINLQWNFSAGDRYARRAASESLVAAQEAVDGQILQLRSAVETQWFDLQASRTTLASYHDYAEQADAVAKSYAEQFRIGRRSLLDVLNAENELFTARSNAITTALDVQLASWRLLSLRGRLGAQLGL